MNRQQMVINTIVFMDQVEQGQRQRDFFENSKRLGIEVVEVRREYFSSVEEMRATANEAALHGISLFYSIPRPLFVEGRLAREEIDQVFAEASVLGVKAVKWNCGDFAGWSEEDVAWMKERLTRYQGLFTVENDQTMHNGTVEGLHAFLTQAKAVGLPIGYTFDAGNWTWVGEDPLENAKRLYEFVSYIHLKDVRFSGGIPNAVALGEGALPLAEILSVLPKGAPVALEYPCGDTPFEVLDHGFHWLEQNR